MLKLEQVNFLLELVNTRGLSVPIPSARIAADTFETLNKMKTQLESKEPKPS